MQIEQWTEHYYPSFISVQAPSEGPAGQASSGLDESTLDARIRIAVAKKEADAAKKLKRNQRIMDATRARKGLPYKRYDEPIDAGGLDWLIMGSIIAGLLLVMLVLALGIAYIVIRVRPLIRCLARPSAEG